jgi:starch synthase
LAQTVSVLLVAGEAAPFSKTGGLGEVVGTLPKALRRLGVDARVMVPEYQSIPRVYKEKLQLKAEFVVPVGWRRQYCGLKELTLDGVPFYFLDNRYYFDRPMIYGYFDEAERYSFFCRATLEALPYLGYQPRVLHCHDWHTGMISPLLRSHYHQLDIKTMFTIHNLKYQGVFPKSIMGELVDLGWEYFTVHGVEFYDQVNFMKAGIVYADLITTVSKSYAEEIQYPYFGENLDGLLRERRAALHGIVNGIDCVDYNPATDQHTFCRYDSTDFTKAKAANKVKLQEMLGLPVNPDIPLVAVVSRLVEQKGLDLVERVIHEIIAEPLQLIVLGTGEDRYENIFRYAAWRYPDKVVAHLIFDDTLARKVYAAADILLMPSLFEPCGIAQLIAMRYGCLPLVREIGGLRDTVKPFNEFTNQGNGFSFTNFNAHDLLHTLRRALDFYHKPEIWRQIVVAAMNEDFSWDKSVVKYLELYKLLIAEKGAANGFQQGMD